ncbi:MAG: tetratricopeptide repeat protein, partial [Solirubrobacteraceae bacterium]
MAGTVFVAGDAGSGLSTLLRDLSYAFERAKPRPRVLAGGFEDGRYVAWDPDPGATAKTLRALKELGSIGGQIATDLTDVGVPYAGLIAQILAASALPLEQLERVTKRERPDLSELAPRLFRELCEAGPVVCIADEADQAASGGLWADLILGFARRVTRDQQLLLILGVDGPEQLGVHEDDEPDSLFCARELVADELACWHPLAAVTPEDVGRWIGPTSFEVLRALVEVTGGRAAMTARLWDDWRRRGAVSDEPDGRWRFSARPPADRGPERAIGRERALDPVGELLDERLKRLIGSDRDELVRTRRLLCCGALEGRRFTADAVAVALGRDRDDVIGTLNDTLAFSDKRPDGLVLEDGSVTVGDGTGGRHLSRYQFNAELDWLTLRYSLTDAEARDLPLKLAQGIQAVYGRQSHRVAQTPTSLYDMAGDTAVARHYRRMGDVGVSRDIILWRAHAVLNSPDPEDRAARVRASQILIAGADTLFHSGAFDDGIAFAQTAHRLAPLQRDQAMALYLIGSHDVHLGAFDQARVGFARVLELYRGLGDRQGEAATRHALATIDLEQGAYEQARAEFARVLELRRELGDRQGEAAARHQLARIDLEQGAFYQARVGFTRGPELYRELGDPQGEAATRHQLASIDHRRGAYEQARAESARVLELRRELGDRQGEAATRHQLASIDLQQGAFDQARVGFTRGLELHRELGDRQGEAATRHQLASIDLQQGAFDQARVGFARVLELRRELGDR